MSSFTLTRQQRSTSLAQFVLGKLLEAMLLNPDVSRIRLRRTALADSAVLPGVLGSQILDFGTRISDLWKLIEDLYQVYSDN